MIHRFVMAFAVVLSFTAPAGAQGPEHAPRPRMTVAAAVMDVYRMSPPSPRVFSRMRPAPIIPAIAVALTLQGEPLPHTPDVYRLATAIVELQDPPPARRSRRNVYIGTLVGAGIGCPVMARARRADDHQGWSCLLGAGIGAAVGAILGAVKD